MHCGQHGTWRDGSSTTGRSKMTAYCAVLLCCVFVAAQTVVGEETLRLAEEPIFNKNVTLTCSTTTNCENGQAKFEQAKSPDFDSSGSLIVKIQFAKGEPAKCSKGFWPFERYDFNCSRDGNQVNLTFPGDYEYEHLMYWRCATTSYPNISANNVIQVYIAKPIESISLKSDMLTDGSVLRPTESNTAKSAAILLTCQSGHGRPSANVTWHLTDEYGRSIRPPDMHAVNKVFKIHNDSYVTSELNITVSREFNGGHAYCSIKNTGTGPRVNSTRRPTFNITYGPDPMGLSKAIKTNYFVLEGSDFPAKTCSADCNPPCTIQWTKNNKEIDSVNGTTIFGKLKKSQEGTYGCIARNPSSHTKTSEYFEIIVKVPPSSLSAGETVGIVILAFVAAVAFGLAIVFGRKWHDERRMRRALADTRSDSTEKKQEESYPLTANRP